MTDFLSSLGSFPSREDLALAERTAARRTAAVGFAGLIAFVLGASALITFAPGEVSLLSFLGP